MNNLRILRKQIDNIDNQILDLLKERMKIVKKIGKLKKDQNKEVIDNIREKEILKDLSKKALKMNLNKKLIQRIWQTIFKLAYKAEK